MEENRDHHFLLKVIEIENVDKRRVKELGGKERLGKDWKKERE